MACLCSRKNLPCRSPHTPIIILVETKARIGVFAIALGAYLPQFPSLIPVFGGQYDAFKKTLPDSVELIDGGIVTTKAQSAAAGDFSCAADHLLQYNTEVFFSPRKCKIGYTDFKNED